MRATPQAPPWGSRGRGVYVALLLLAAALPAAAQEEPIFGVELELRGREVTALRTTEKTFEDYKRVLDPVVRALGGDPSEIKRIDFSAKNADGSERPLMRAEWTDRQGRTWRLVPEWVTGGARQQTDYELVTPKLTDPAEIERVVRALNTSGAGREGLQSSTHIHIDGRGLIKPSGDATALINLINLHETYEPLLRRLFDPQRGAGIYNPRARSTGPEGAYLNRFSRPLYLDHPDLLAELAALPPEKRTKAEIERLFNARAEAEAKLHGETELGKKGWKYRSLNVANLLGVNPNMPPTKGSVEFRMNDLDLTNPETHRLQVELYRALVKRAGALAAEGKVVPAPKHPSVPAGESPAIAIGGADPVEAKASLRALLKELKLDPARYEGMLTRNVRAPPAATAAEFDRRAADLRIDANVRVGSGQGESGLSAALDRVRQGERGAIEVRVVAGSDPQALENAKAQAERINTALYLREVAHAGARASTAFVRRISVKHVQGEVVFTIQPTQLLLKDLARITRLLAGSVKTAAIAGEALPTSRGLVERAASYATDAEGRRLSARSLEVLGKLNGASGDQVLLPLRDWGKQPYVPGPTARDLRFRAERYLADVIAIAEAAPAGAVDPALAEQVREKVRAWARETGLGELLLRSTLPRETVNPAAPRDVLARFRRADGTVEWKRVIRERALPEVGGLLHFGLALFLKEVAVVAATGDRARIEEFFDSLLTTDFYKHYGLFVAGARVGEVAYTRYLQRYVKPKFVNGLLKTNLVLAAGIALPMIVEGKFEGRAFAISVGSLGLSSAAVRGGVASIKWVLDLKKAQRAGALAKFGARAGRLSKLGGWFYTAVELAVILYVAEEVDRRVTTALDARKARDAVGTAAEALIAAANDPRATPETLAKAAREHHEAWIGYRDFLYRPMEDAELLYAARLGKVARLAKIKADERAAAIERIKQHAALRANIERRYGSLDAYAERLVRADEAEIKAQVNTYTESYGKARDRLLDGIYTDNRRKTPLLSGVTHLDWLLAGAPTGASGDPFPGRTDIFATWGRANVRSELASALRKPSGNRLEAYDDEAELLGTLRRRLARSGKPDLVAVLVKQGEQLSRLAAADRALFEGKGLVPANAVGASGALDRAR